MTTKTKTTTVRPLGDRVLVRRLEAEGKTAGGIFIPDTAQEKRTKAEVISVGPGKTLDSGRVVEPQVKRGDIVWIGKYTGTEVKIDNEDHLIVREEDILGVETA